MSSARHIGTLEPMSSTVPTQVVANLHLHLEYDSGLDVIAAAMATVPEDSPDTDEHRAHVSHDISSAVAHLLDIDALTPEGCPIRVTEASMQVSVDIESPHGHEESEAPDPEEVFDALMQMVESFELEIDALGLSEDETELISQAADVAGSAGPPPFDEVAESMDDQQVVTEWGVVSGYLSRSCRRTVGAAFDALAEMTVDEANGTPFQADSVQFTFGLPQRWRGRYDSAFMRRFILTLSEVTTRLTRGWEPLSNLAQVAAMSVILDDVYQQVMDNRGDKGLDIREPDDVFLEILHERLLDGELREALYDPEEPEFDFEDWFILLSPDERVAPYASVDFDEDADA